MVYPEIFHFWGKLTININVIARKYMALSKEKKQAVIDNLVEQLSSSKITVMAEYTGLTVKEAQELRNLARENGTTLVIVKNRLVN